MATWYVAICSDEEGNIETEPQQTFPTAEAAKAHVFDRITVAGTLEYKRFRMHEQFKVVPEIGTPFFLFIFVSAF